MAACCATREGLVNGGLCGGFAVAFRCLRSITPNLFVYFGVNGIVNLANGFNRL